MSDLLGVRWSAYHEDAFMMRIFAPAGEFQASAGAFSDPQGRPRPGRTRETDARRSLADEGT